MLKKILKALERQRELLEEQNRLLERQNEILSAIDFGDEVYEGVQNILTYGGKK